MTVSADGTLIDPTTGGSVTTLFDANNIASVESQGSGNFSILSPTVGSSVITQSTNPMPGCGPTSIIPANSSNGTSQTSASSNLIYIPKVEGGHGAYLSMDKVQEFLQGKTELYASQQKYKYNTGTVSTNSISRGQQEQNHLNSIDQSNTPKLTSLLTSKSQGIQQSSPQKGQAFSQTSVKTIVATTKSPKVVMPIVRPQLHNTTPQKTFVTVNQSQLRGTLSPQRPGNVLVRTSQPKHPGVVNQQTLVVLQPSGTTTLPFNQNTVCNYTTSSSVCSIQPSKQTIGNSVNTQIAPTRNLIGQQRLDASTVLLQQGNNSGGKVHSPYITSITTGAGEKTGSNTVVSGSSACEILSAFGDRGIVESSKSVSSPQNVSLTVVDPSGYKNTVTRVAPGHKSVSVGTGRGRGRGAGGMASKIVYIHPQKHSTHNSNVTTPQQNFYVKQGNNIVVTPKSAPQNVVYQQGKNIIIPANCDAQSASQLINMVASSGKLSGAVQTVVSSENTSTVDTNVGNTCNPSEAPSDDKCINKKFVKVKDGGELAAGTTYLVSGPNGLQKKMVFNGENFVDLDCKYMADMCTM